MHITRRSMLVMSATGVLTLACTTTPGRAPVAVAQTIPGGTLDPRTIKQFATRLVVPSVMTRSRIESTPQGEPIDCYELDIRQFDQQVLPPGMPSTSVWGYVPADDPAALLHTPAATIEAVRDRATQVRWRNRLVDRDNRFLPHLFAVDPTIHWANPEQRPTAAGVRSTDVTPSFKGAHYVPLEEFTGAGGTYSAYRGPVPISVHLHGAMGLGDESDGYPEAWVLPAADNIPEGYARHGRWWPHMRGKATALTGHDVAEDCQLARYPNRNRPSCLWVHDHAMGLTRLNVLAGYTGFYIVREATDTDRPVDTRTGRLAVLPGDSTDRPGTGELAHELPLAIQDRSFNEDGSVFYPDSRRYFDATETFIPDSNISPVWVPDYFGNTIIVNGHTWPYANLTTRRYRLRILNGCNSRALQLDFTQITGAKAHLIGNEAGFLPQVHDLFDADDAVAGRIALGPAERVDIILDLTATPPGRYVLGNSAPEIVFAGSDGWLITQQGAETQTTGRIMELRVSRSTASDPSTPAENLRLPQIAELPQPSDVVRIALDMTHNHEPSGEVPTQVATTYLSQIVGDPAEGPVEVVPRMWSDPVWINPQVGQTLDMEVYNWSVVPHPFHVHEVSFEVVARRSISYVKETGELTVGDATPIGPADTGRKDTVMVGVGEMVVLRARFDYPGQFVMHCHNLEHEDNEMMVPYRVGPTQPGEPAVMAHDGTTGRVNATVAALSVAGAVGVTAAGFALSNRADRRHEEQSPPDPGEELLE